MDVSSIAIHKLLVLNGAGSIPTHAGCVIDGNCAWDHKHVTGACTVY